MENLLGIYAGALLRRARAEPCAFRGPPRAHPPAPAPLPAAEPPARQPGPAFPSHSPPPLCGEVGRERRCSAPRTAPLPPSPRRGLKDALPLAAIWRNLPPPGQDSTLPGSRPDFFFFKKNTICLSLAPPSADKGGRAEPPWGLRAPLPPGTDPASVRWVRKSKSLRPFEKANDGTLEGPGDP